jgi:hypothetical protein
VVVDEPYVFIGGTSRPTISLTESDMALLCLDIATGDIVWDFTWDQGFGHEEVDGLVVEADAIYQMPLTKLLVSTMGMESGWFSPAQVGGNTERGWYSLPILQEKYLHATNDGRIIQNIWANMRSILQQYIESQKDM